MKIKLHGCGKRNLPLHLYLIPDVGKIRALDGTYHALTCGYVAENPDANARGVILCVECAASQGYSPPKPQLTT